MYTSEKRWIFTKEGRTVEAGPGISGTLIVAAGSRISTERARQFGLLPPEEDKPKPKPMVAPVIVHGPEGKVELGGEGGGVNLEPSAKEQTEAPTPQTEGSKEPPQVIKPWQGGQPGPGGKPAGEGESKPEGGGEAALTLNE